MYFDKKIVSLINVLIYNGLYMISHIERVFLYAGLMMTNLHTYNHPEQQFSPMTKLLKNWKRGNFLWLKLTNGSAANRQPRIQKYNVSCRCFSLF